MAEEIQIEGGPHIAKIRSPWAAALLPIVTLGIYYFVWYYKINREMSDLGKKRVREDLGQSPGTSLLAITLGALVIVPAIVSTVRTAQRIQRAQDEVSGGVSLNGWLCLVLYILLPPAFWAYEQAELNKVWLDLKGSAPAPEPQAAPTA
jgi:hypothetical protein